jgi:hypothetical protein
MGNISDSTTINFLKVGKKTVSVSNILSHFGKKTSYIKDIISSMLSYNISPKFRQSQNPFIQDRLSPTNYNLFFGAHILEKHSTLAEKGLKDADILELRYGEQQINENNSQLLNTKININIRFTKKYSQSFLIDQTYTVGDFIDFLILLNEEEFNNGKIETCVDIKLNDLATTFTLITQTNLDTDLKQQNSPWCLTNKCDHELNPSSTFEANNVVNGSELKFCKAKPIKIIFQTSNSIQYESLHYLNENIGSVIENYKKRNEFGNNVFIIAYFKGKQLDVHQTLSNYNIQEGAIINVLITLKN